MLVEMGKNFKKISRASLRVGLLAGVAVLAVACSDVKEVSDASHDTGNSTMQVADNATDAAAKIDNITTSAADVPPADGDVDMDEVLKASPLKEMEMGDANAPVTIVEYMSMTCPHCANFHANTFKDIQKNYIETGKVRFIMREFPFDPRAAAAIMLARCAPEEQFFPLVDMFFQQQSAWARAEDARAALLKLTKLAGFTQETFNTCLTNQQLLDDVTEVRNRGANDFGIQSTPSFIVNGKRYSGDMSVESMSALIDSYL